MSSFLFLLKGFYIYIYVYMLPFLYRLGAERLLSSPMEPLTPLRPPENFERTPFCSQCCENYEKEAAKLSAIQKSFSEASLPQWLQKAKLIATDDHSQVCSVPMQSCSIASKLLIETDVVFHIFTGKRQWSSSQAENSRIAEEMEGHMLASSSE